MSGFKFGDTLPFSIRVFCLIITSDMPDADVDVVTNNLNEWRVLARYQAAKSNTQNSRPQAIRHIVGIASVRIRLVGGFIYASLYRETTGRIIRRIRAANSATCFSPSLSLLLCDFVLLLRTRVMPSTKSFAPSMQITYKVSDIITRVC